MVAKRYGGGNAESLRLLMIRNFEAAGVMDLTAREAWIERVCKIKGNTFTTAQLRRILAAQAEERRDSWTDES